MSKTPLSFPKIPPPLFLFILVSLPLAVISQSANNPEQSVLLNLRQQWGNPPSIASWSSASSPCNWPEINCAGDGSVTAILLRDKNITEKIPAAICDLKNLTWLDLSWNYIPGDFPKVLYNCSKLQFLDLSQNYFVGGLPGDIDRLSGLQFLDLASNNFTGDVPAAIGRLSELKTLNLHENLLNGTVPGEIGNLSNLEALRLAYNVRLVRSPIPPELGKLKRLKILWMTVSNLIGEIPESFAGLSSLEYLDLSGNNLVGSIPSGLFMLKNLSVLLLYHNGLSGEIPRTVESLKLTEIDISMNNFSGSIPEDFGKLSNLTTLNLFSNQLSGPIPASLGLLPNLKVFKVFINKFNGTLPPEIGLHSKLEAFEVSDNRLTGRLPENLCRNGALRGVIVFSNNLSGELPKSLGDCDSLQTVQLHRNNFSGEVPPGLWTAMNLSTLMISYNSFSGQLPSKLPWNMSRLEISSNRFSGEVPAGASTWASLVVFKASNNLFSGEIPIELTSLSRLTTLLLDGNRFSGELPPKIVSWDSLDTLNLSRNELTGQIPEAIASLPDLLYLDLSENRLSGEIPPELGRLRLSSLNLSSNELSGKIPGEFDNLAYENSFLNNPSLCADSPNLNLRSCLTKIRGPRRLSSTILALILILAICVLLVTVSLTLYMVKDHRRKKHGQDLATWRLTSFQRLDFTECNVLRNLTENNLIGGGGSGKVYRIGTNSLGEYVAVKKIWNNMKWNENLEKEFLAEVQILGMIRHSNIVKLLCCISSEDSKLLVYEYMENQSLDMWLHGKKRKTIPDRGLTHLIVLDWPRRLQIAIGAAQGLCYMHHDCSPPIIHRDVKSSNILLDSEFKARIADFGLAKILAKHGEPHSVSAIAGSFGYMAPEYAYTTKVNEKIDVYSFGVVLLELTTGREPSSGDEQMSLAEWSWQHYSDEKPIADALDEEIKKPCYLDEMTTLFKLGLICTSTSPSARPSMAEVLQIIRRYGGNPEACEAKKVRSEFDVTPLLGNTKYLSSYKRKNVSDDSFFSTTHS
ncbi:Serine/threonine protein kinase [Trema orientale]|uniref:non-specific serine/threonine protein kinase n=1 Tax=Trema orientale TaxID=63057 RepID=A0A2P5DDH8_TREOI|nr:Serine/threonine protein kinase [Trema orientale]